MDFIRIPKSFVDILKFTIEKSRFKWKFKLIKLNFHILAK